MRAVNIGLVVGGLLVAVSAADAQQSTQIKPRVLLMVDTSGSMTEHFTDTLTTGGDGSTFYSDALMTRSLATDGSLALYSGYELGTKLCPSTTNGFDGVNSRIYAAKQAVTNVVNGSGDIDWGLMRYSGTQCAVVNTTSNASSGSCTSDDTCATGKFCIGSKCVNDDNLCLNYYFSGGGETAGYGSTRHSTGSCTNRTGGVVTWDGDYGTSNNADDPLCASPQVCYSDADCNGGTAGSCVPLAGSAAKVCTCTGGPTCDGTIYTCGTGNYCVYHKGCRNPGGVVIVDPSVSGSNSQILQWVDGIEALPGNLAGIAVNPELRASNGTPLAGAARAATTWYQGVIGSDTKSACRPYVLIQMTDGYDTGDSDGTNGPVAAAGSFVAATVAGAKNLNKVYVVGLAFGGNSNPTLDAIAHAGGTGKARLANSQADIQAALADIVSSSVLHEICNDDDDNCNDICDEDFPDVAVDNAKNPKCTPRAAKVCDNGASGLCHATGRFACSADGLSEVCVATTCTATPGASVSAGAGAGKQMRLTNVSGMTAGSVGKVIFVSGSSKVANNGGFLISAFNSATSIDVNNPGVVLPDSSSVSWAIPTTQGTGTTSIAGGSVTITLTSGSAVGPAVGDTISVLGAANPANNGVFIISAIDTVNNKITFANATGVGGDSVTWAVNTCKGVETCNGLDDDCDGVIDNCGGGGAGSCCTSNCPACAVPPFIETCNNCDDDCDGVIDDNLVDTGLACGADVGDCVGGVTMCCSSNPNGGSCSINGTTDAIYCKDNNNGYPKGTNPGNYDFCDGTDDNCNGVPNDGPGRICYDDGAGHTLPMGSDGVGVCHHGVQQCLTIPLCGTSGVTPPNCTPGACPVGWPANKTCPNPSSSYQPGCPGLVAPSTEFCDGLDNDCNNCVDDNPQDAWINTECCGANGGSPLSDCDGSVAGTMCQRGHWQCSKPSMCAAGAKTCVGAVAKSPEVCNGIDDDCNGIIDDVPGVGAPCTGPGIYTGGTCTAVMKCVTNGQPPQCVQVIGPVAETCNGLDDNCNGQIDDNGPPLAVNPLPGVGVACDIPMPPADKPPCKPGTTVCQSGAIVCVGAVGPMPNQCNGISTDCTGNPNTNGNCPTGFQCYQGNCVAPCDPGEFPCPGGYACDKNTTSCDINGVHSGCCVPDACAQITCPLGFNCQLDAQGNATCIDPCVGVNCPPSYICKLGTCVDGSCRTQGCPDGQICVSDPSTNMFACQPDPCANVMCDGNQFCQNGVCVGSCAGPCPNGQYCSQGQCVPDPCAHTPCVEGQVCRVENGVGVCVENQCQFGCNIGQACCGGECVADQCENLHCPEDTHCALTPDCQATCETNPASPKDQVVGAGGGGFGCAVAGHGSEAASSSLLWLLAVAGALLFRRRRAAEVRK